MRSKSYKIDFEIYLVFIIVICFTVFSAIYSSVNISNNQDASARLMRVDVPSLQKLDRLNFMITRSKMYSTNWVYLPDFHEEQESLRQLQSIEYPELKSGLSSLMNEWKEVELKDSLTQLFADFEKLMAHQKQIMDLLSAYTDYDNSLRRSRAEGIVQFQIQPETSRIIAALKRIINTKKQNTDAQSTTINVASRSMMYSILSIGIATVFIVMLAGFYFTKRIIVPTMKLRNVILQMGKGEIPDINLHPGNSAIGQMTAAVQSLSASLRNTAHIAHEIGSGNLSVEFQPLGPNDELGNALVQMQQNLCNVDEENRQRAWISVTTEKINARLRENTDDIDSLADSVTRVLVQSLEGSIGALYFVDPSGNGKHHQVRLQGSYGIDKKSFLKNPDGLILQVIKDDEAVYLRNVSIYHLSVSTSINELTPSHILILPLKHHGKIYGVLEIAGFRELHSFEINFLKNVGETIGSTISSVQANTLTKKLLAETRKQAARLSSQEEELRRTNDVLSHQSNLLQASEEELRQSNLELKKKARELQQKNEINEQAKEALSIKAKELELNNKYKSEFLANMSHELRTPLNSVLILAKLLEENKDNNLSVKQTEYASIIHKSGKDLLLLINDILDLSKIEAGKVELIPEKTSITEVCEDMRLLFSEMAGEKGLEFFVSKDEELPADFISDKVRLEQIIKNLLSNAFKFTPAGGRIQFSVRFPDRDIIFNNSNLINRRRVIEFSVSDTGIGIPGEKQALIFEAFQQADGSTNRSYGGTGLGLSISKMLVAMLGGEMRLESKVGAGSIFSFYLPMDYLSESTSSTNAGSSIPFSTSSSQAKSFFKSADDRNEINTGDKVLLIVEDDKNFARVLLDMAHERGFKAVVASDGNEGLQLATHLLPSAIVMDMQLPGMNGWSLLDHLKANPQLSSIPVHVMSAMDRQQLGIDFGALAYLKKPLDKCDLDKAFVSIDNSIINNLQRVLIIEDVAIHREIVANLLASHHQHADIISTANIAEATEALATLPFDCIILDLDLGNGPEEGVAFLELLKAEDTYRAIPVIVFTGQELSDSTATHLRDLSAGIVSKESRSFDALLEQTGLFLSDIPESTGSVSMPAYLDEILCNKCVLIVDDDMRNIYAISTLLTSQNMRVLTASNGVEALSILESRSDIDVILMDIMMPEMDGFEAIQRLRKIEHYRFTPVITLTAKAMVGDRERCLQCGASDYISKPVQHEQLFSLMRVWLYEKPFADNKLKPINISHS